MAKITTSTPGAKSSAAKARHLAGKAVQTHANGSKAAVRAKTASAGVGAQRGSQRGGKKSTALPAGVNPALGRILRPNAAQRWTLPSIASITPQYIEMVLRGGLAGNHVQLWELFDLMFDSWPELAACQQELTEGVMEMKSHFAPFAEEGEPPTTTALEKQKVVSAGLRRMQPDPCADENDLDDTLKDILDGWFRGVVCLESDWHQVKAGKLGMILAPRATFWAHPTCFAWSTDGRLCLRNAGTLTEFPQHKFLVGIHKAKSGSALGASILRPLAWWWCAANFSSDWLLNLAQIFGLPFRWANHDPNASPETVDAICAMLQNMGSAGWAAFPAGTTLDLKAANASGDHSPQGDLLDRADRYARMLILGQTMSGSQDSSKGGGKAFGSVEADVKKARVKSAAKYACKVINSQLIPSMVELNYGDRDECPVMVLGDEEEAGADDASRDRILAGMMELSIPALRQKYNMPEPGPNEERTQLHKAAPQKPGNEPPTPPENDEPDPEDDEEEPDPDEEEDDEPSAEKLKDQLKALCGIKDDAIFGKQLLSLGESIS